MWAMAEENIVDPYSSNADGGGGALNFQGGDGTQKDLGIEFNLGVDYTYRLDNLLTLSAGLQGGYFLPGDAFKNASGNKPDPIGMIFGQLLVRWLPAAS